MTRTITHKYFGVTYQIKIRTIVNSDMSSIVIWRDETALSGTSFHGAIANHEAKVMAERMIEEYYLSAFKRIKELGLSEGYGFKMSY